MAGLFEQLQAYIDANTPRNTRKPVNAGTVIDQGLLGGRIGQVPQRAHEMYQGLLGAPAELAALGSPAMRSQVDQAMTKPQPIDKDKAMQMAMDTLQTTTPVGGLAGMFIGKGAKTWDAIAAQQADDLLKQGIDPREVWKQTGTMKGVDGALRQEIPDNLAVLSGKALPTQYIEGFGDVPAWKVGDALSHDDLYKAYPDLAGIESSFSTRDLGAEYKPGMDWISYSKDGYQTPIKNDAAQAAADRARQEANSFYGRPDVKQYYEQMDALGTDFAEADFYKIFNKDIENEASRIAKQSLESGRAGGAGYSLGGGKDPAKSVTLHELQHAIQQREGWASGGSPEALAQEYGLARSRLHFLEKEPDYLEGSKQIDNLWNQAFSSNTMDEAAIAAKEAEIIQQHPSLAEARKVMDTLRQTDEYGFDSYKRLAGEAEARLTQSRMGLDAAQRRQHYPYDQGQYGLDVPLDSLIVRGLLNP